MEADGAEEGGCRVREGSGGDCGGGGGGGGVSVEVPLGDGGCGGGAVDAGGDAEGPEVHDYVEDGEGDGLGV